LVEADRVTANTLQTFTIKGSKGKATAKSKVSPVTVISQERNGWPTSTLVWVS